MAKIKFFDPNQTYISLSHTCGRRIEEMGLFTQATKWENIRAVLIAALRDTAEIMPGTSETHFLAKFHIQNATIDRELVAVCVIAQSAPSMSLPNTLIVRGLMSTDAALQLMHRGKGLKPLKFDDTMKKVGTLAKALREEEEIEPPEDIEDVREESLWRRASRLAKEKAPDLSGRHRNLLAALIYEEEQTYRNINIYPLDSPKHHHMTLKLAALKWAIYECVNSEKSKMH